MASIDCTQTALRTNEAILLAGLKKVQATSESSKRSIYKNPPEGEHKLSFLFSPSLRSSSPPDRLVCGFYLLACYGQTFRDPSEATTVSCPRKLPYTDAFADDGDDDDDRGCYCYSAASAFLGLPVLPG